MDSSPFSARRATPEDLPSLEALWQKTGMPWEQLGQYLNEFQVVADADGTLVGAVGLLVEGENALLHSEAIRAEVEADAVRASLWRRLQIVARNQGAKVLWTQEDAPYWQSSGFASSSLSQIPGTRASFLDPTAAWLSFPLFESGRAQDAIQEQFAILEASRQQDAEDLRRRIKLFRVFAYVLAFAVIAGCFVLLSILASNNPDFFRRLFGR